MRRETINGSGSKGPAPIFLAPNHSNAADGAPNSNVIFLSLGYGHPPAALQISFACRPALVACSLVIAHSGWGHAVGPEWAMTHRHMQPLSSGYY
jgi:hypothetical protein